MVWRAENRIARAVGRSRKVPDCVSVTEDIEGLPAAPRRAAKS
jgi:hypothetical protein